MSSGNQPPSGIFGMLANRKHASMKSSGSTITAAFHVGQCHLSRTMR